MSPPDPRRAAFFEWDLANEEHLAQHDVSPYEVEQVFHNDPTWRRNKGGRAALSAMDGRMTPDEERELVERIERGEENPDDWEELPPASSDEPPPKRLGAVVSVRLDPDLAAALSQEAERRSRVSGAPIGHTTLARQLIAEGLRPPAQRVTVELEVGQDGTVRALPVTPPDRDVA